MYTDDILDFLLDAVDLLMFLIVGCPLIFIICVLEKLTGKKEDKVGEMTFNNSGPAPCVNCGSLTYNKDSCFRCVKITPAFQVATCMWCGTPGNNAFCSACKGQAMTSLNSSLTSSCARCGSPTSTQGLCSWCVLAANTLAPAPNAPSIQPTPLPALPSSKPPVPFSGMAGYSEQGTPDDWDMAIGTVRGYRWFKLSIPDSWVGVHRTGERVPEPGDINSRLVGAYSTKPWKDGPVEATCSEYRDYGQADIHEPPETRVACGCGFWGYWKPDLKVNTVLSRWNVPDGNDPNATGICVFASIKAWGRIIIGEKGFRSQYAQIESLAIGDPAISTLGTWSVGDYNPTFDSYLRYGTQYVDMATDSVKCSNSEVLRRMTRIEDLLSLQYPSARVLSSQESLTKLFPPDKNYGGG